MTLKAQETETYRDYLDREGEDNELHYTVKLQATKLLLENTENTFVTPVFNGSASLRDAAGGLIESTVKAIRRKKEVNEEFFDSLFAEMSALHHLDEAGADQAVQADLGPLPPAAVALLCSLGGTWILLAAWWSWGLIKKKNKSNLR